MCTIKKSVSAECPENCVTCEYDKEIAQLSCSKCQTGFFIDDHACTGNLPIMHSISM